MFFIRVFFIFFLSANLFRAQDLLLDFQLVEVFISTYNLIRSSDSMRYKFEAQGCVWNQMHQLTQDYKLKYYPFNKYIWNDFYGTAIKITWLGFDLVGTGSPPPAPFYEPKYAFGIYKLTAIKFVFNDGQSYEEEKSWFYLDFRDTRYPGYTPPVNGHMTDIWLRFSDLNNKFSYNSYGGEPPASNWEWIDISSGQYLPIWEIKDKGKPKTELYESFWQNCLVLIPTSDNHPRLVWGSYPERKQRGYSLFC